jgi:hypothetical protein
MTEAETVMDGYVSATHGSLHDAIPKHTYKQ